jgi:hypothetical protein
MFSFVVASHSPCCAEYGVGGDKIEGHATPYLLLLIVFPLPYYLTHSSMDYRQPIEPEIVILVTIGLVGFRDWTASADSQKVENFRQCQREPLMAVHLPEKRSTRPLRPRSNS